MRKISIKLESEELGPVQRLAEKAGLTVDQVAYAALNLFMQRSKQPGTLQLVRKSQSRTDGSLPAWADQPREIHAYESKT